MIIKQVMQYAHVNGEKLRASPGLRGECPVCGNVTVSHCGKSVAWHWKHKAKVDCNANKGKETDWHIDWKNQFPEAWQEVVVFDESGEKHQADILRPVDEFCIEIQHSPISDIEIQSRNKVYGNIAWIVDGSRLKSDVEKFENIKNNITDDGVLDISGVVLRALSCWEGIAKPIFIDFRDQDENKTRRVFYFFNDNKKRLLYEITVVDFVNGAKIKGGLKPIVKKAEKAFQRLVEFKLRQQGVRKIGEDFFTSYGGIGGIFPSRDGRSQQAGWNASLNFVYFDDRIEQYYENIKEGLTFAQNSVTQFGCIKKEYISSLQMIELIVVNIESKDYFLVKINLVEEGLVLHDFRAMYKTSKSTNLSVKDIISIF